MRPRETLPRSLGRYELVLPIATGGMGVVYLGRSLGARGFARDVAIKVLRSDRDAGLAEDLVREARIAELVRHPNVVQMIDVGEEDGEVYLVMEFVDGDSLHGLQGAMRQADVILPIDVGLRIVVDGLVGLHAAHELRDEASGEPLGLVHRDFSPQNLLVSTSGVTRLTDFGIAKTSNAEKHTTAGVVKGKFSYMSPEQARSESLDRRSDVWAAAAVAWEVVAGRRLFPNGNDATTLLDIVTKDPIDPRDVDADLPAPIADAIMCGLVRDRRRRCPTAQAFAQRLRDAAESSGIELASDEGVRSLVDRHLGPRLAERRLSYRAALATPTTTTALAGPTSDATEVLSPRALVAAQTVRMPLEATEPSASEMSVRHVVRSRRRVAPFLAFAAAGTALAAVGWFATQKPEPVAPVASAATPAVAPPTAEVVVAPADPPVASSAASSPVPSASAPVAARLPSSALVRAGAASPRPRPTPTPTEPKPKCPAWSRCR